MAKRKKEKCAAILTINRPDEMSQKGRQEVTAWLRRNASHFLRYGDKYASIFRARYLYN